MTKVGFAESHFSHFCRPPTDSASHWRTKMVGAAVRARGARGGGSCWARASSRPSSLNVLYSLLYVH